MSCSFSPVILRARLHLNNLSDFRGPPQPIENAFAESFIGKLRDECLNTNWFIYLKLARDIIEDWRKDYNDLRPHSSLKGVTQKEYAEISAGFSAVVLLIPG
jgi:putative transposase